MIFNRFFRYGDFKPKGNIFLDYASTTPVDKEVANVMSLAQGFFANPSALYSASLLVKEKINEAKKSIAEILNCQKEDIIFTSGGTESNNLAILGIFETYKNTGFIPHFVTTTIEHPAVLEVYKEIEKRGGEVTYVPVSENGVVKTKDIESALKENTVLVSVMYANNEIGTIQPIKEIGRMVKEYRRKKETATDREEGSTEPSMANVPFFHTDACQAGLYLSLDVLKLNVDLMTLDGIKMYGPRSTGILYVKSSVELKPILFGGGQQRGLRSGTESLPNILGFSKCLEIAEKKKEVESERLKDIRDYAISEILNNFKTAKLNGDENLRLPNNINICFSGIDSEFAVIQLDVLGFSVSYSSSCRTLKEDSSSYVISSIGKDSCSLSSLRFTLGRETKKSDIDKLVTALRNVIK